MVTGTPIRDAETKGRRRSIRELGRRVIECRPAGVSPDQVGGSEPVRRHGIYSRDGLAFSITWPTNPIVPGLGEFRMALIKCEDCGRDVSIERRHVQIAALP